MGALENLADFRKKHKTHLRSKLRRKVEKFKKTKGGPGGRRPE